MMCIYGMYGMVWCGMLWYGVYGMYGMVSYGMVCYVRSCCM